MSQLVIHFGRLPGGRSGYIAHIQRVNRTVLRPDRWRLDGSKSMPLFIHISDIHHGWLNWGFVLPPLHFLLKNFGSLKSFLLKLSIFLSLLKRLFLRFLVDSFIRCLRPHLTFSKETSLFVLVDIWAFLGARYAHLSSSLIDRSLVFHNRGVFPLFNFLTIIVSSH